VPRKPDLARYHRDARTKRGLSVAEVAQQVGVSPASSWRNGASVGYQVTGYALRLGRLRGLVSPKE
jgi:hypothetical protein